MASSTNASTLPENGRKLDEADAVDVASITPGISRSLVVALEMWIGAVSGLLLLEHAPSLKRKPSPNEKPSPSCGPLPFASLSPLKAAL